MKYGHTSFSRLRSASIALLFLAACGDAPSARDAGGGLDASVHMDAGHDSSVETLCPANERVVSGACVACPPGSTNAAGDDASGADTTCDATFCATDEHVVSHACVACVPGSTNVRDDNATGADTVCSPTICEANQHVGGHICLPCAEGTTNAAGDDASSSDTSCTATLCEADEHVVSHACVACAPGSENLAGDDASGNDTTCDGSSCASDQRVSGHQCVACAPGTTNDAGDDATGADTACDVTHCDAGHRVQAHACVACAAGTTNDAGDDASSDDTTCDAVICPENQHVAGHACVPCAAGTIRAAGDDASAADTSCSAVTCDDDERVQAHVCVPCGPGSNNASGDDASGDDTSCDGIACASNEHVVGHVCTPCGPGTTNVNGDDASGPDTSCDAVRCATNEHVDAHGCVPCAPGSTNPADDDASGADTSCAPTLCDADQRVESHACIACAPGSANAAGDDATGANTSCEVVACLANERVVSHACVPCEPGTTNVAGDLFAGPNTRCDVFLCKVGEHVLNHACAACSRNWTTLAGHDPRGPDTECLGELRPLEKENGGCSTNPLVDASIDSSGFRVQCLPPFGVDTSHGNYCPHTQSLFDMDVDLGFTGDGRTCVDIDECAVDPDYCPMMWGVNGCQNAFGGVVCYDAENESPPGPGCQYDIFGNGNGGCAREQVCTPGVNGGAPTCSDCPSQPAPGSSPRLPTTIARPYLPTARPPTTPGTANTCIDVDECNAVPGGPCAPGAYCWDVTPKSYGEAVMPGDHGTYGGFICACGIATAEYAFGGSGYNYDLDEGYGTNGKTCTLVRPCAENEYVTFDAQHFGVCVPCPPGTVNEAGDQRDKATSCDPIAPCDADEHVSSNVCVRCLPGRTNQAGDIPRGVDTTCLAACPVNTFVSHHACVPCPIGTARSAGDAPAGGDTSCQPSSNAYAYDALVRSHSPSAYWTFDDAAEPTLESITEVTSNAFGEFRFGRWPLTLAGRSALLVDGYAEAPHAASRNPAGDFSVELWTRPSALGTTSSLITSRSVDFRGYVFYVTESHELAFWVGDGVDWRAITGPAFEEGVLYHVVGTYDASAQTTSLYVNGMLVASSPGVVALPNTTRPLRIGAGATEFDGASYPYFGEIDNVAIYPSALTAAEVQAHFVAGTMP